MLHPRNPYAPTVHLNVRMFVAHAPTGAVDSDVWWFGGGMDLTPYYGFAEDAAHFHGACRDALTPFGDGVHAKYKKWCDEYFFLKHRNEPRGIGGIFFDDLNDGGFDRCFALMRSVGDHFLPAYAPIVERRKDARYGERERDFQAYRRGRYVEFNLVWDRGTLFGLQSNGRTEAILMSLPPLVKWRYDWRPEPGSPEARLYTDFLVAKEWVERRSHLREQGEAQARRARLRAQRATRGPFVWISKEGAPKGASRLSAADSALTCASESERRPRNERTHRSDLERPDVSDRPTRHLIETRVSSEPVFDGKLLHVRRDTVRLPDGTLATREHVVHPGAVLIVPVLPDERLVVVRQYRYPLDRVFIEFPAGKLDPGETGLATAQRELIEEAGYTATTWTPARDDPHAHLVHE